MEQQPTNHNNYYQTQQAPNDMRVVRPPASSSSAYSSCSSEFAVPGTASDPQEENSQSDAQALDDSASLAHDTTTDEEVIDNLVSSEVAQFQYGEVIGTYIKVDTPLDFQVVCMDCGMPPGFECFPGCKFHTSGPTHFGTAKLPEDYDPAASRYQPSFGTAPPPQYGSFPMQDPTEFVQGSSYPASPHVVSSPHPSQVDAALPELPNGTSTELPDDASSTQATMSQEEITFYLNALNGTVPGSYVPLGPIPKHRYTQPAAPFEAPTTEAPYDTTPDLTSASSASSSGSSSPVGYHPDINFPIYPWEKGYGDVATPGSLGGWEPEIADSTYAYDEEHLFQTYMTTPSPLPAGA